MKKNYNYILQENKNDCGIASLQTIFLQFGLKISREKLLENIKLKEEGISAYELINTSKKLGLDAYGVKSNINNLKDKMLPCIAHTIKNKNFYHYIVILEINRKNKTVKIMDPSVGISTISYKDFEEITTNIFLIFEAKNIIKTKDKRFRKIIINIFKENKKLIYKSLFSSLIFILFSLIYNYYLKYIMTYINSSYKTLYLVLFTFMTICLLKNIIEYLKNNIILKLNNNIDKKITKKVINHIIYLPYKYYKEKPVGELVTIINDIENFKDIITKIFVLCLIDTFLVLIVLIYISLFSIIYSIILLLFILVIILVTLKYQYIFNDIFVKIKQNKISYNSNLINSFSSYDSIKNLNIESKTIKELNKSYSEVLNNNKKYSKKYYNYNFITNLIIEIFYLILIFISSLVITKNNIDISYIVLFSSTFNIIFGFINGISEYLSMAKLYQTSIDKVLDVLEVEKEQMKLSKISEINKIEFKNISYKIENNTILNDVNLSINKNDHLFIKGKSGIGKSTLIKLLLRYYKADKGQILIDNVNINDLDLSFIRKNITYVSQNETLLNCSLIDNFNKVNNSLKKIDLACKTALVDELFKDKKIDYNFYIEENGSNLSGGERKKVIIARALLTNSKVLVLDEVFNEIDVEEEKKILNNIYKNYPNLTIILISHRHDNINLFNKTYELKEE